MALIGAYPCSNVSAPITLSITTASTCSFLTVTAVTGNLFVILAVIFDPNRTLRSRVNFLVANLAAAGLIVCVYAFPLSVEFHIRESMSHLSIASTPAARPCYTRSLLPLVHSIATELGCIDQRSIHRHKGAVKLQNGDKQETSCHVFTSHLSCPLWPSISLLSDRLLEIFLCICEYSCNNNFVIEYFP